MHQNLDAASNLLQKKLPIVVLKSREDSPLPPGEFEFSYYNATEKLLSHNYAN